MTEHSETPRDKSPELTALVGCGVVALAVLILTLLFSFFYAVFRAPVVSTLQQAAALTSFFGNLVVAFYAFPAFRLKKDRGVLCIAIAALMFAYAALFSVLLGVRPPATAWHVGRIEAQWFYATYYTTGIVGLVLYAYGICSVIKRSSKL